MAPRQRTPVAGRSAATADEDTAVATTSSNQGLKENPKGLPVEQPTEADIARDRHDYFNLLTLPLIVASTAMNYDIDIFNLSISFHGRYFHLNWVCTLSYFMADLVWVARVPICVKSPGVIIKHHIAAMFYLMCPVFWPEFRIFFGSILSVEINTFFLIARRIVYKPLLRLPSLLQQFVSTMFFVTWIWIRCYLYPAMLVVFLSMAADRIQSSDRYVHLEMIFIVAHAALCVLNAQWTYDLFKPIVQRWLGTGPKTVTIQSGL